MDFTELAAHHPTPFYVCDAAIVRARLSALTAAFKGQRVSPHYAVKANDNRAVIKLAAAAGVGACLVSVGEMQRALGGGIKAADMLMNGVGKTEGEIEFALKAGIGQLNVESLPELETIARVARDLGKKAVICLRINPDISAKTHTAITTGRRTDKFGLLVEDLPQARAIIAAHKDALDWRGFSCHIGSQIHDVNDLAAGYRFMAELFAAEKDSQPQFDRLDLGGGFGVSYRGDAYAQPADYAKLLHEVTGKLQAQGVTIQLEPGRYIVAEAGTLVTRVVNVKLSDDMRFLVLDAGMNDLIRPALYDAYHPIRLARGSTAPLSPATIVGPVCESADVFARDRDLPNDIEAGDVIEIGMAGAYGMAMASFYNARTRPAEVMIDGDRHWLTRRAFTAEEYDRLTLVESA